MRILLLIFLGLSEVLLNFFLFLSENLLILYHFLSHLFVFVEIFIILLIGRLGVSNLLTLPTMLVVLSNFVLVEVRMTFLLCLMGFYHFLF